uniref:Uncharacterized protein n=1 Tax=Cucumis melo TaxID=3656 RepID=A0A9I9CKS7_CUCME
MGQAELGFMADLSVLEGRRCQGRRGFHVEFTMDGRKLQVVGFTTSELETWMNLGPTDESESRIVGGQQI